MRRVYRTEQCLTMGGLHPERGEEVSRGHSTSWVSIHGGRAESSTQEAVIHTGVKSMGITEKFVPRQLNLLDTEEWRVNNPPVRGVDVFHFSTGRVREQWVSDCEKERVLTSGYHAKVADVGNLERACRQVVANKGSAGVDGMTVGELHDWFNAHCGELREALLSGRYRAQPVLEVEIPKSSGGTRALGVPTVIDRLVQQAIHQVVSPRYERIFSENSYGFRPGRSAHDALHKSSAYVGQGRNWIVDIDLEKFFDTVNQQRLMWLLSRRVGDKRLLKLIHGILKSGILAGGLLSQRISGTPQGGPLSPLLSNIVLDELDKELERRGHTFVRYADDLRIFVKSREAAHRVMDSITRYLEKRLRLKVNRDKSKVCKGWETTFLGHSFLSDGTLALSNNSEKRLCDEIRRLTSRRRGISFDQLLSEVNTKLRGWLYYFRYSSMKNRLQRIIGWLHHRLRCFRLKQCKRVIGIVRFLRKQKVPAWRCWIVALSGKGWWRLSATPQAHEAMNNQWLREKGLFSLMDNYQRLKLEETAVYQQVRTVV